MVESVPPGYERTLDLWNMLMIDDLRAQKDLLSMVLGPDAAALIAMFDENAEPTKVPDVQLMHIERFALMRAWSEFHQEFPVMISPTWAQRAFTHGADLDPVGGIEMMTNTIRPVIPSNLLGTPAAVTPAGVVDGLPVGVQILGDRFSDALCLTVAAEIESLVGPITPIDPVEG